MFSDDQHLAAYQEFLGYKTRVPVRGAIMLNQEMDSVVLVKGWKTNASWSFPRGKINKDEPDIECAIREVYEETGYDIKAAGLVTEPDAVKAIDVTMREQHVRLFVFRGVPEDTPFEPKTRKEISKIHWYKLCDLPTLKKRSNAQSERVDNQSASKFYMVAPFLGPLKKWINQQRKIDAQTAKHDDHVEVDEPMSEAFLDSVPHNSRNASSNQTSYGSAVPQHMADTFGSGQYGHLMHDQPLQQSINHNQEQSRSLLAALRGTSTSLEQSFQSIPRTPFEQITQYIQEPPSPHPHHHAHEASNVPSYAPPSFNDGNMQDWQHPGDITHAINPFGTIGTPRQYQNDHYLPQQSPAMLQNNLLYTSTPDPSTRAVSNFGSIGGPMQPPLRAPPSAHTMNLLNAFRSGPPNTNIDNMNPPMATLDQRLPPQTTDLKAKSLLDLFKTTPARLADPLISDPNAQAPNPPMIPVSVSPVQPEPSQIVNASNEQNIKPPTARKTSTLSMITRTLPKQRKFPVPSMDNDNFPILGSQPVPLQEKVLREETTFAQPVVTDKPTRKHTRSSRSIGTAPIVQPMKILARPASSKVEAPLTPKLSSRPPSRGKPTPSPGPALTILQRPTSDRSRSRSRMRRVEKNSPAKPTFQPQILKRGETPDMIPMAASSSEDTDSNVVPVLAPASSTLQRNALLSLFAQSQSQPLSAPLDTLNSTRSTVEPLSSSMDNMTRVDVKPITSRKPSFIPPQIMSRTNSPAPSAVPSTHSSSTIRSRNPSMVDPTGSIFSRLAGPLQSNIANINNNIASRTPSKSFTDGNSFDAQLAGILTCHGSESSSVTEAAHAKSIAGGVSRDSRVGSPSTPIEKKGFLMDFLENVARGGK